MKIALATSLGWLASIISYVAALNLIWHQDVMARNVAALAAMSVVPLLAIGLPILAPTMFALRAWRPSGCLWSCPLAGALLGSVPTFFAILIDRKSTRLNSSHVEISYAVFCL